MIKSVTVTNHRDESLVMDLFNPFKNGMNIDGIEGIGPGKGTVNSVELYGLDGAVFNSARLGPRLITLSINFLDSPDIETTRRRTYRYFPLKREVTLMFKTDARTLKIKGVVEGNEPDIFSKKEGTKITIQCMDPYFDVVKDGGNDIVVFSNLAGGFSFPFSNSVGMSTIQFGKFSYNTQTSLDYPGDIDTGVTIDIEAAFGPVTNPMVSNLETGQTMSIVTSNLPNKLTMSMGDTIRLTTITGRKSIYHIRNGKETKALMALAPGSEWIYMIPGMNVFSYSAQSGIENMSVSVHYDTKFSGV